MFAKLLSVALVATVLPLTFHAAAAGCPNATVANFSGQAYLVLDPDHSAWVYEETNGINGLQRGGSSAVLPGDSDVCTTDPTVPHDTLVL
jgi:hypothetical protein